MLSGGEKVRLALAKIFKRKPNVLILDEPTNHMDIVGKETLESMLVDFPGTVIFVSHDRYFVSKVATKLLYMEEDMVRLYEFGYEQYEQEVEARNADDVAFDDITRGKVISSSVSGKAGMTDERGNGTDNGGFGADAGIDITVQGQEVKSAQQSYLEGKDRSRLERKMKKLEEKIGGLETAIDEKKAELEDPANASDYMKLQDIQNEIDSMEEEMLTLMMQWDELTE